MVFNNIEILIEKYENGETTLKEEQQLKDYFSQEQVAPHLEMYKPMFQYFLETKKEQFTKDLPLKPKKTNNLYKWISVAAVAVLMLGIYTQLVLTGPTEEEKREAQLAYNQTMEALSLVSSNFKKGTNGLNLLSANFEKGAQQINHVDAFNETTNKIFKLK